MEMISGLAIGMLRFSTTSEAALLRFPRQTIGGSATPSSLFADGDLWFRTMRYSISTLMARITMVSCTNRRSSSAR
jgi:hypothetical protein